MIVPDVNVLVYAFRTESPGHVVHRRWLTDLVAGADELGLCAESLVGFVRVVTNRRVVTPPAPTRVAMEFADRLVTARRSSWLASSGPTWSALSRILAEDPAVAAGLVPDAQLAALCLANGAILATADRGFARYPGLRWFDPGRPPPG